MTNPPKRALPIRIWLGFWRTLNALKNGLINTLFLVLFIAIISSFFAEQPAPLPEKAPLLINLNGPLVDQISHQDPSAMLLGDPSNRHSETRVDDLVNALDTAAKDPRITGAILQLDQLENSGISKLAEVAEALIRFKHSGKPIYAYGDNYTQQQYFLAAHANEVALNEMGNLLITGYGVYRNYYKNLLDTLKVNFHVFRVGSFKDYVEPFTRTDMSAESRQHNSQWVEELWGLYSNRIETQRQLDQGHLQRALNTINQQLKNAQGNPAQWALQQKLVDKLVTRQQINAQFIQAFGEDKHTPGQPISIPLRRYLTDIQAHPPTPTTPANIGLIVATGTILDGQQPDGSIGADTLSQLLRQAKQDTSLKALVIRIDSGGGSAFASEIIRQDIQAVRAAGKPVFISMGSVAASGGYWLATAADQIWATPHTLTGSIGVFGLIPTFENTLNKIGITTDGFATHELATATRLDRPLSPNTENLIQQGVESIYQRFIHITAQARNLTPEQVHAVAQGRVWTASRAQALGLIDHLGYLNDVISACAQFAKLPEYQIKRIERTLTPQEQLVKLLMEQTQALSASSGPLAALSRLSQTLWPELAPLAQTLNPKQPLNILSQCLDCGAP